MKVQNPTPTHPFTRSCCASIASRLGLHGALVGFLLPFSAQAHLAEYQTAVTNESSLISYYTFEASDAADAYGTNNGTLEGTTAFATGPRDGTALSLAGSGWVNLGYVEDFTFTNDESGSVEAWVRAGNLAGNGCIAAARWNFDESPWQVNMFVDKEAIGDWNGVSYQTVSIPNASTNWHHVVAVYDGGTFTVYWDGELADTIFQTVGYHTILVPTQIGSPFPYGGGAENWVGELDEVAIYADPLTLEDVQAHYDAMFIGDPPVITKQPKGGTYLAGVALTLSVEATGPEPLSYQWYKDGGPLGGQTSNTFSIPSLGAGNVGTYWVTVSNVGAVVTSSNASIALGSLSTSLVDYQTAVSNETSLISYYTFDRLVPEDVYGANDGTMAGTADWDGGVGGGAAKGLLLDGAGHVDLGSVAAFNFASGEGTVEGWIRADWVASSAGYWPCMYANRDSGTVWELLLSDAKKTPSFYNGAGSAWFNFPGNAETNWHHFATVFTNGTASFYVDGEAIPYSPMSRSLGAGPGTVQLGSALPGTTSSGWIGMLDEVAFYSSALPAASVQAHYAAYVGNDPPAITSQPWGGNYLAGQLAELSVAATGAQRTYQWYKDGVPMPGVTNAVIGPLGMTPEFSGDYYVVITNSYGSVTSDVASIYVPLYPNVAGYQAAVLGESSLISYYTFDDGNPLDFKNAHDGTNAGTVAYGTTGPGGATNTSLSLDGNGHIDLGYVPDFDFADSTGTVEAWIRAGWTNGLAGYNPTIFSDRLGDASAWSVHVDQWKYQIGNYKTAPWNLQWLPIGLDGNWHHYAIVFRSNTVSMYLDGNPRGSFNQPLNNGADKPTQIGSAGATNTVQGWIGDLDEVAFYSDALDAEAISSHYQALASPSSPTLSYSLDGTQLTLFWSLDVTGFTLESAEAMPPISWTPVGGVVSNQVTVTIDASIGLRFYRLSR